MSTVNNPHGISPQRAQKLIDGNNEIIVRNNKLLSQTENILKKNQLRLTARNRETINETLKTFIPNEQSAK